MKRTPVNTWLEESDSVGTPTPWSDPELRRKARTALVAVGAIAGVGLIIFGATAVFGSGDRQDAAQHRSSDAQAPATIDTSANGSLLECQEVRTPELTESSGDGDQISPEGLIIAYEHAFFTDRDAARMVSMSVPSPTVATEEQLASSIKNMPIDSPWCVSITPAAGPDNFDVAVRFIEADGVTVTTWNQTMTVAKTDGDAWKIVSVQGR